MKKRIIFSSRLSLELDRTQKKLDNAKSPLAKVFYLWRKARLEKRVPR